MYRDKNVLGCDYSFWVEDDWVIRLANGSHYYGYTREFLFEAMEILRHNPELLSVRFNNQPCDEDKVIRKDGYLLQGENYTQWGPTFTFQPTVVRTRDMYIAYKLIEENQDKIGNLHIELQSGLGLKQLSLSKTPFAFFDYNEVKSVHIGVPNYK
jgi:hypothetical protein